MGGSVRYGLFGILLWAGTVAAAGGPGKAPHQNGAKPPSRQSPPAPHIQPPRPATPRAVPQTHTQTNTQPGRREKSAQNGTTPRNATSGGSAAGLQSGAAAGAMPGPAVVAPRSVGPRVGVYRRGYGSRGYYRRYRTYRNAPNRLLAQEQAQLRRIRKLATDLDALAPGAAVAATARDTLTTDMVILGQAGVHPVRPLVQTLAGRLVDSLPHRKSRPLDTLRLAYGLEAVVNGPRLGPDALAAAIDDAREVLKEGGVGKLEADNLAVAMKDVGTPGAGVAKK